MIDFILDYRYWYIYYFHNTYIITHYILCFSVTEYDIITFLSIHDITSSRRQNAICRIMPQNLSQRLKILLPSILASDMIDIFGFYFLVGHHQFYTRSNKKAFISKSNTHFYDYISLDWLIWVDEWLAFSATTKLPLMQYFTIQLLAFATISRWFIFDIDYRLTAPQRVSPLHCWISDLEAYCIRDAMMIFFSLLLRPRHILTSLYQSLYHDVYWFRRCSLPLFSPEMQMPYSL